MQRIAAAISACVSQVAGTRGCFSWRRYTSCIGAGGMKMQRGASKCGGIVDLSLSLFVIYLYVRVCMCIMNAALFTPLITFLASPMLFLLLVLCPLAGRVNFSEILLSILLMFFSFSFFSHRSCRGVHACMFQDLSLVARRLNNLWIALCF